MPLVNSLTHYKREFFSLDIIWSLQCMNEKLWEHVEESCPENTWWNYTTEKNANETLATK